MNYQRTLQAALDSNLFTVLKDRVLFFDGDTLIEPSEVYEYVEQKSDPRGGQLCVTEMTSELESFNTLVDLSSQIKEKTEFKDFDHDWNIPKEYITLDLEQFLADRLDEETISMSYDDAFTRALRIREELNTFETLGLLPVLRVIIYVINRLRSYKIVWGIGRGSCVASYVLYLIGVHDVDSILYELDYTDFLRTSN